MVFEKTKVFRWWNWFISRRINHCYLLQPNGENFIVINKSVDTVDVFTLEEVKDIIKSSKIIKVRPVQGKRGLFMLNTCVGLTKQILGIRKPFIWTPKQLMRYLKNGK